MIDVCAGAGALVEARPLPSTKACLNKLACSLSIVTGSETPLLEVLELQPEIMMDVTNRVHTSFFITYLHNQMFHSQAPEGHTQNTPTGSGNLLRLLSDPSKHCR